jgi:hypothetical protein
MRPALRLTLSRSLALQRMTSGCVAAVGLALYLWSSAYLAAPIAAVVAMTACLGLLWQARRVALYAPCALEPDEQGNIALFYPTDNAGVSVVPGDLIHVLHWPGVMQHLEFRGGGRGDCSVLVMADAMPAESFRVLAAWSRRALHRKNQFAWSAPENWV